MRFSAIVVAAGRGLRAGGGLPKQYRPLAGKPVLRRSIDALLQDPRIEALRVVIHPDDQALFDAAVASLSDDRLMPPVFGGATRASSVRAGLADMPGEVIVIHDAARPLLPPGALARLLETLDQSQAASLALPVADALWQAHEDQAQAPQDRANLWAAQTPQGARADLLHQAHSGAGDDHTDDISALRAFGIRVRMVPGDPRNFKLTRPEDFAMAEALMTQPDIRTGLGYDVHAFGPGDHVVLNGIRIPHDQAMVGHSDADVAMHAITDALFGAIAEGDIGQWFPPSDPQWKGAASEIFLRRAVARADELGFEINSIDCTIICEFPKIGPHAHAMRESLARITGLDTSRINVKATTSERLGFTGRSEGIAAQSVVTVQKR